MAETLDIIMQGQLKDIVRRIENIKKEQEELSQELRDIYKDASYSGFDVKILREVIKRRLKKNKEESDNEEMISIYMTAVESFINTSNLHD